jgi:hypothetical protein
VPSCFLLVRVNIVPVRVGFCVFLMFRFVVVCVFVWFVVVRACLVCLVVSLLKLLLMRCFLVVVLGFLCVRAIFVFCV